MNVLEVSRNLFKYFGENDTFQLEEDLIKVVPFPENEVIAKGTVTHALKAFEDQGLVARIADSKDNPIAWVLTKPLDEYSQTVELSFPTIEALSQLINEYCEALQVEKGKVNPLNITEDDVQNIILIAHDFKKIIAQQEGTE